MYTITERKMVNGEKVESVRPLSDKEYEVPYILTGILNWYPCTLLSLSHSLSSSPLSLTSLSLQTLYRQRDPHHKSVVKTRRCFLWKGHYFQLDIFTDCTDRCVPNFWSGVALTQLCMHLQFMWCMIHVHKPTFVKIFYCKISVCNVYTSLLHTRTYRYLGLQLILK